MIPVQTLSLKEDISDDRKDDERNAFLYDLELYEVERTSVIYKTDTVGGYLTAIFKEGYGPTEGDNSNEWPMATGTCLLKFEMPIPCQRHEDIAEHQKHYRI